MTMIGPAGTYGILAIVFGMVVFTTVLVLTRRNPTRATLLYLVGWCLVPILVGHVGTVVSRYYHQADLVDQPTIRLEDLARASRRNWTPTLVGLAVALPSLLLVASAGRRLPKEPAEGVQYEDAPRQAGHRPLGNRSEGSGPRRQ